MLHKRDIIMNRYNIVLLFFLVGIVGCVPTIKDYDAEKLEYEQIKKIKNSQATYDPFNAPATPKYVKVAKDEEEGIFIEVIKLRPITNQQGIKLDVWKVNAVNTSPDTKCVDVKWKLQDFEFQSEEPLEFLIKGGQTLYLGKMTQSIWSFDDVLIALPPSGYVDSLHIRKAEIDAKTHRLTCEIKEEDIDEPKEDTDAIEM